MNQNEPRQVKIGCVGDVMLGELMENYRNGVRESIVKKHVDPFEYVRSIISGFDLCIGNLECPVADQSFRKGFFREILRAPGDFAKILAAAPFHLLGLANNHALDHGREALRNCVSNLENNGITVFGVENGRVKQTKPVEISIRGVSLQCWAFNLSNLGHEEFRRRIDHIRGCIKQSREPNGRLLLYLHWGEEYTDVPPSEICKLAIDFIEMGTQFVIGHHSHRLQGVTQVADGLFAPSLGNFIFDDRRTEGLGTAILEITLSVGRHSDWRMIPLTINSQFQPVEDSRREADLAELNAKLAKQLYALHTGDRRYDKVISDAVARGHARNRRRMRLLMVAGFWRYAGSYTEILNYMLGGGGQGFSICDASEWSGETSNN